MQENYTLTATGTTTIKKLDGFERMTFASVGDAVGYTLTAQIRITDNGNWFDAQDMADGRIYSTVTAAREIRFNLTALGSATTVDIEINGAKL